MKYIILLVVLGVPGFFTSAIAQQQEANKFFVYIQNENGSPFYVREQNNTVLSSSHAGYIIIPQLSNGSYVFTIGLAGDQVAEAAFEIHLNGQGDKGFLLREGAGQLALYSLKDFKEIEPIAVASAPGNRIVNIPSIPTPVVNNQPAAEPQPAAPVAVNQAATPASPQKDTGGTDAFTRMLDKIMGTTKKPAVAVTSPHNQPSANPGSAQYPPAKSHNTAVGILPVAGNNADSMTEMAGGNQVAKDADTSQNVNSVNMAANNITGNAPPSASSPARNDGLQFINFLPDSSKRRSSPAPQIIINNTAPASLPVSNPTTEVASPTVNNAVNNDTTSQIVMQNSDCQQLASEDFFQKMRRKMASKSDDEGMFRVAQKYFSGGACFSTQQIQSLTYLFITDEYKYKFLELAYPHAYDSNHFPSLIKTLGNDYYRGRFRAMVK